MQRKQPEQQTEYRIGNVVLESPFLLAPLAGITDSSFRRLCRRMGAAMVCSEMVSAKGLFYNHKPDSNSEDLLRFHEEESPISYQLFGANPEIMAWAVDYLKDRSNMAFDINMGCPVPKVVKNGEGSALMKTPRLAAEIVRAMVTAEKQAAEKTNRLPKPITVKCRMGWDADHINVRDFAARMEDAGASAVAVHGRTRDQFYSGKADWEVIARVKEDLSIPVIGNGDLFTGEDACRMITETGCDFVMIARGALGNPWIFKECTAALAAAQQFAGLPPTNASPAADLLTPESQRFGPPSLSEKKKLIEEHIRLVLEEKGESRGVREMRKQVGWYAKGLPHAAEIRRRINSEITAAGLQQLLDELWQ